MSAGASFKETPKAEVYVAGPGEADSTRANHVDSRWWKGAIALCLALLAFYLFMFLRYRPYDVDNPWFLSFSYNRFVDHIRSDEFLKMPYPGGMDGTQYFGLLAAFPQYVVARVAGWRQRPMEMLSASSVALSLFLWSATLRRLGYSSRFIFAFVLVAGLSEPFVSTAEKFRYEYMSLLLISAGLLLLSYRRVAIGFFLVALAVEVEPMAVLGVIPAAVLAYSRCRDLRFLTARIIAAGAAAIGICLYLHPELARLVFSHTRPSELPISGGFFRAYFLERQRHLPELLFFIFAGWLYWRNRRRIPSHYLGISAAILVAASLLTPHGNDAYTIFLYPYLVGMALVAVGAERYPVRVAVLAMAYLLPQYIWLVYTNRGLGYRERDIEQVSTAIERASQEIGSSADDVRVYGDYGLWFAHPHLYRAASPNTLGDADAANLFVCYEQPLTNNRMVAGNMYYCPDLRRHFPLALISTTLVRGNSLYVYTKGRN